MTEKARFHGKRTNPNVTPCHVCHENTDFVDGEWTHPHSGDRYCGTGDGSTAYPEFLWQQHERDRLARNFPPEEPACEPRCHAYGIGCACSSDNAIPPERERE
jgi:hypothetical protein